MNKSNISNETLDQLKSIVGINNFIDDVNIKKSIDPNNILNPGKVL